MLHAESNRSTDLLLFLGTKRVCAAPAAGCAAVPAATHAVATAAVLLVDVQVYASAGAARGVKPGK